MLLSIQAVQDLLLVISRLRDVHTNDQHRLGIYPSLCGEGTDFRLQLRFDLPGMPIRQRLVLAGAFNLATGKYPSRVTVN